MKRKKGAFTDSGGDNPQENPSSKGKKRKGLFPRLLLGVWLVGLTVLLVILYMNTPQDRPPGPPKTVLIKKIDKLQEDLARSQENRVRVVRPETGQISGEISGETPGEIPDRGDLLAFGDRLNRMEDRLDERLSRLEGGYRTLDDLIGRLDRLESAIAAAAPVLGLTPSQVDELTADPRGRTGGRWPEGEEGRTASNMASASGTGEGADAGTAAPGTRRPAGGTETGAGRDGAGRSERPVGDLAAVRPGGEGGASPGERLRNLREGTPEERAGGDRETEMTGTADAAGSDSAAARGTGSGAGGEGASGRGEEASGQRSASNRKETGGSAVSEGRTASAWGNGERAGAERSARGESGEADSTSTAGTAPGGEGAAAGTEEGGQAAAAGTEEGGKAAVERAIAAREAYVRNRLQRLQSSAAPGGERPGERPGDRMAPSGPRPRQQAGRSSGVEGEIAARESYIRDRLNQQPDPREALRFPSVPSTTERRSGGEAVSGDVYRGAGPPYRDDHSSTGRASSAFRSNPIGSSLHQMSRRFGSIYQTPGERKERNQAAPGLTMFPQRDLGGE